MEPSVDTVIEDERWEATGLPALADRAVCATLDELGLDPAGYAIVVMGCDDARIAALNTEFRGKPVPTNVLSWPSDDRAPDTPGTAPELPEGDADDPEELGDIAIAWETCTREAAEQGKTMDAHVTHLLVHATLHLLGYDHQDNADATLMEGTEIRVLARLGVANPY